MSELDIVNMALAFLGDEATVTNLTPPEGSAQAEHAARFYDMARDAVLERYPWPFAKRRGALTLRTDTYNGWQYAYDKPTGCLKVLAVMPPSAADDYSLGYTGYGLRQNADGSYVESIPAGFNTYVLVPFTTETSGAGDSVILTNLPEAHGRWIVRVTDTTKFSPLFKLAMAKLLAAFMAGPIYKGGEGAQMSASMLQHFEVFFGQAVIGQGNEGREDVAVSTPWISGR